MGSPAVHIATGRKCAVCGYKFNDGSLSLRIYTMEKGFRVSNIVCTTCYNKHYEDGE